MALPVVYRIAGSLRPTVYLWNMLLEETPLRDVLRHCPCPNSVSLLLKIGLHHFHRTVHFQHQCIHLLLNLVKPASQLFSSLVHLPHTQLLRISLLENHWLWSRIVDKSVKIVVLLVNAELVMNVCIFGLDAIEFALVLFGA